MGAEFLVNPSLTCLDDSRGSTLAPIEDEEDLVKQLLGVGLVEDVADAVSLDAKFALLADGTSYPDAITLDVASQEVKVEVDNSGYRVCSTLGRAWCALRATRHD